MLYRIQVNLIPSDPIAIRGNLGIGFRQEVVGRRKMPESRDSDIFRHLTTSGRNPIPRIPPTPDEFLSDPMKSDNFSDRIRQSDYSSWGAKQANKKYQMAIFVKETI